MCCVPCIRHRIYTQRTSLLYRVLLLRRLRCFAAKFAFVNTDTEVDVLFVDTRLQVTNDANALTLDEIREEFIAHGADAVEPQRRTVGLVDCNVERHELTTVRGRAGNGISADVADDSNFFHKIVKIKLKQ